MKTYGSFEVVDSLSGSESTDHQYFLATKTGSDGEPDKVIKLIRFPRKVGSSENLALLKGRMQAQAVAVIKSQQAAASRSRHIAPIYQYGTTAEGIWFCTDFLPKGTLKEFLKESLSEVALQHIASSVVEALLELRAFCRRSHGSLSLDKVFIGGEVWGPIHESPLFLSEPSMEIIHDFEKGEISDLRDLGALIFQLVTGKEVKNAESISCPVAEIDPWWEQLGERALYWLELCNRLLNPNLSLKETSLKALRRELKPKRSFQWNRFGSLPRIDSQTMWKFALAAIILGLAGFIITSPGARSRIESKIEGMSGYFTEAKEVVEEKLATLEPDKVNATTSEEQPETDLEVSEQIEAPQTPEVLEVREAAPVIVAQVTPKSFQPPAPIKIETKAAPTPTAQEMASREAFVRPMSNSTYVTPITLPSAPEPITVSSPDTEPVQPTGPQNLRLVNEDSAEATVPTPMIAEIPAEPEATPNSKQLEPFTDNLKNALGIKFVWIAGLPEQSSNNATGGFVGVSEITQSVFERVMSANPSGWKGADVPVHGITWQQAVEFCARMTVSERKIGNLPKDWKYTLPTREQWQFFNGIPSDFRGREWDYMVSNRHPDLGVTGLYEPKQFPVSVDVFRIPNKFGLYDVSSNVREWSMDRQGVQPVALGWSYLSNGDPFDRSSVMIPLGETALTDVGFRCIVVPNN